MAALAVRDEQPAFTPTDVRQSQAEDFATAQTGEQHRVDHRPIPIRAQRLNELDDVVVIEDARQMSHWSNQWITRRSRVTGERTGMPCCTGLWSSSPRATRCE